MKQKIRADPPTPRFPDRMETTSLSSWIRRSDDRIERTSSATGASCWGRAVLLLLWLWWRVVLLLLLWWRVVVLSCCCCSLLSLI